MAQAPAPDQLARLFEQAAPTILNTADLSYIDALRQRWLETASIAGLLPLAGLVNVAELPRTYNIHPLEHWRVERVSMRDAQQANAQRYISEFQLNRSYSCWYNTLNPAEASFFKEEIDFWDYFWLVLGAVLFLVLGVPLNLLILYLLGRFLLDLIRGRVEIVW